jgi:hypothetical protein
MRYERCKWSNLAKPTCFQGQARTAAGRCGGDIVGEINLEYGESSQVKLLITNNAFCIVQRATAKSKTGIFRDCGVAEAPPGFQASWSDCMHFSLSFCSFCLLIWS